MKLAELHTHTINSGRIYLFFAPLVISNISLADIDVTYDAYEREDYAQAFSAFSTLTEDNDSEACYLLVFMYYGREGITEKDDKKAAYWFDRTARLAPLRHKIISVNRLNATYDKDEIMRLSNLLKYLFCFLLLLSQLSSANPEATIHTKQTSCTNLYAQLSSMEKAYRFSQYSAYDDKFARLAGLVMTFFTPAIIYTGYANYQEFLNEADRELLFQSMEVIRYQLTQQHCYALR